MPSITFLCLKTVVFRRPLYSHTYIPYYPMKTIYNKVYIDKNEKIKLSLLDEEGDVYQIYFNLDDCATLIPDTLPWIIISKEVLLQIHNAILQAEEVYVQYRKFKRDVEVSLGYSLKNRRSIEIITKCFNKRKSVQKTCFKIVANF